MDKVMEALEKIINEVERASKITATTELERVCHGIATEALADLRSGKKVVVDKERLAMALTGDCPLRAIDIEGKYCIKYDYDCPVCLMAYIQPREEDSDERD